MTNNTGSQMIIENEKPEESGSSASLLVNCEFLFVYLLTTERLDLPGRTWSWFQLIQPDPWCSWPGSGWRWPRRNKLKRQKNISCSWVSSPAGMVRRGPWLSPNGWPKIRHPHPILKVVSFQILIPDFVISRRLVNLLFLRWMASKLL